MLLKKQTQLNRINAGINTGVPGEHQTQRGASTEEQNGLTKMILEQK